MSHPLDKDALYHCSCGSWHYKWEVGPFLPCAGNKLPKKKISPRR